MRLLNYLSLLVIFNAYSMSEPDAFAVLMQGVRDGNSEAISRALQQGAEVNTFDGCENTPLLSAVDWRKPKVVELLLEKGANPNLGNTFRNPLYVAAHAGLVEIVSLLLGKNADIHQAGCAGVPALVAAREGHFAVLRVLLAYGAHPDRYDSFSDSTLLMEAQGVETIRALLEAGADPNAADEYMTPLRRAMANRGGENKRKDNTPHKARVRLLLEYGVNIPKDFLENSTNAWLGEVLKEWEEAGCPRKQPIAKGQEK